MIETIRKCFVESGFEEDYNIHFDAAYEGAFSNTVIAECFTKFTDVLAQLCVSSEAVSRISQLLMSLLLPLGAPYHLRSADEMARQC